MACRYYDEALIYKIRNWVPENSNLRVLKPDESKRLIELTANDKNDRPLSLPLVALSRNNDIELLSTVKSSRTFDGLKLNNSSADLSSLSGEAYERALKSLPEVTAQLNVIPIKLEYQLDIYTKTYEEGDEYLRNFLFKLINNPVIKISIPYNNIKVKDGEKERYIEHIANIRVLDSISDTSDITEHLFAGQFTRWSIQLELQDAFLFNTPFKKNWKLDGITFEVVEDSINSDKVIESETFEVPRK